MLKKAIFLSIFAFAFVASASAAINPTPAADLRKDSEGCYLIKNADELYGFAAMVNAVEYGDYSNPVFSSCVKLEDDITVNSDLLGSDGYPGSGSFESWTPIQRFNGSFDGQGHVISGLFADVSGNENADAAGFIAEVNATSSSSTVSAEIKNVGLEDSYFKGKRNVGAFVGKVVNNGAKLTITNSYTTSRVVGGSYSGDGVGGFVGYNEQTVNVYNSYFAGKTNGNGYLGAFIGNNSVYGGSVNTENAFYKENGSSEKYGTAVSETLFENGALANVLRSYEKGSINGSVWGQNIPSDKAPKFRSAIQGGVSLPTVTLHSFNKDTVFTYVPGFKTALPRLAAAGKSFWGWYDNSDLTGNALTAISKDSQGNKEYWLKQGDDDGCRVIVNADDLFNFAAFMMENSYSVEPGYCAKLVADIVVNENVLDADGKLNSNHSSFRHWTPMNGYYGVFDGNGHTISGLYVNDDHNRAGLFASVADNPLIIKNLGIKDSYFRADQSMSSNYQSVGGFVAQVYNSTTLRIEDSYFKGKIEGRSYTGGFAGVVSNASIEIVRSYVDASIVGEDYVGAFVGEARSFSAENSYALGSVKGSNAVGGFAGRTTRGPSLINSYVAVSLTGSSNVDAFVGAASTTLHPDNCYYLDGLTSSSGIAASSEDFASGLIAVNLHVFTDGNVNGRAWGQDISANETYPNLSGVITGSNLIKKITFHLSDGYTLDTLYLAGEDFNLPSRLPWTFHGAWYDNSALKGSPVTTVPAENTSDLDIYADGFVVTEPKEEDGYYQITNKSELFGFAAIVNGTFDPDGIGYSSARGKLKNDITFNSNVLKADGSLNGNVEDFLQWTPIGASESSSNRFQGVFDGENHKISGLVVSNDNGANGFFGYVYAAEIKNLQIEDSYIKAESYAGGLIGFSYAYGSYVVDVENCSVKNSSVKAKVNAGGLVGYHRQGDIQFQKSFNENTFVEASAGNAGGLFGYVGGPLTASNIYNTGSVFGNTAGGIVGYNGGMSSSINGAYSIGSVRSNNGGMEDAFVGNTYYNIFINGFYPNGQKSRWDAMPMFENVFEKGVLARILNEFYDPIWGQDVANGDLYPNFKGSLNGASNYGQLVLITNDGDRSYYPSAYVEGVETELPEPKVTGYKFLGWYDNDKFSGSAVTSIPATVTGDKTYYAKLESKKKDGCYEIASADDLYEFAEIVNTGMEPSACGKLVSDITVNPKVLDEDGFLISNNSSLRSWTPIGYQYSYPVFSGTFDGQGHTISGLYVNNPSTNYVGLFGSVRLNENDVVIQNLNIKDSYFRGNGNIGGLVGGVGYETKQKLRIENVSFDGSVEGYSIGGLIGYFSAYNSDLNIVNSYVRGHVGAPGSSYMGGLVGQISANNVDVVNSYSSAIVFDNGSSYSRDPLVAYISANGKKNIVNSFYIAGIEGQNGGVEVSQEDFETGKIAMLLHDYSSGSIWGQNVAKGEMYPNFSGKVEGVTATSSKIVFHLPDGTEAEDYYYEGIKKILPNVVNDQAAEWYANSDFSGDVVTETPSGAKGVLTFYGKKPSIILVDGCYQIYEAAGLYAFADIVNNGDAYACGKLMNDVVLNSNVLDENGKLSADSLSFKSWTPIGSSSNIFAGSFDGMNHTVSGLYTNITGTGYVGMFGYVRGADVQINNLKVVDSYVSTDYSDVGGIVGTSANVLSMNNVSFAGAVSGYSSVGGIVGNNDYGTLTVKNASFEGSLGAKGYNVGGIVGNSSPYSSNDVALTIENAVAKGTIESQNSNAGGVVGYAYGKTIISNSGNKAPVTGYGNVGGIAGYASNIELRESYNSGNLVATNSGYVGGLIGYVSGNVNSVSNSYNVGSVTGSENVGGLVGYWYGSSATLVNSYNYGTISGSSYTGEVLGYLSSSCSMFIENVFYTGEKTSPYGTSVSKTVFENGALATILNAYKTEYADGSIWGQDVSAGDKYPNFSKKVIGMTATASKIVYHLPSGSEVEDSYYEGIEKILPKYVGDEEVGAWYLTADMSGEPFTSVPTSATGTLHFYTRGPSIKFVDGCYEITDGDGLTEFANMVNAGNKFACGKLIADVVINKNVLDAEGNLNAGNFTSWTPIGQNYSTTFAGTFDGQGHTVSGIYAVGESGGYTGLFGFVRPEGSDVIIRNVGLVDSYIKGSAMTGGLVGFTLIEGAISDKILVSNTYAVVNMESTAGSVYGNYPFGALIGYLDNYSENPNAEIRIENSWAIDLGAANVGSINATYGSGTMTISNVFSLEGSVGTYGTKAPATDFANGTVAELLHTGNSIWGQNIGKGDKYPNFSGKVEKNFVLTWNEASDEVDISTLVIPEYVEEVVIEDGKQFYADGKIYEGTLDEDALADLAGKELKPISGVALETAGDDTQAELSGSTETDKLIVPVEIRVAHIDIEREFKGTNSTLMVPFNVDNVDTNVLKLIEVDTVYKDLELNAWVAEGTRVESIKAHTPYIINYTGKLSFDDVELVPNVSADTKVSFGNWTFVGAYEGKTWLADDPELGKAYGFSGVAKEGIAQGQFVRIGVNAKIAPMRAYLLYNSPAVMPKPGVGVMKSAAVNVEEALPSSIILRVVDRKKNVVEEIVIEDVVQGLAGEKLNSTEEVKSRWYDLKGRRMNGKPTAHGAFIKNNKAVLNK